MVFKTVETQKTVHVYMSYAKASCGVCARKIKRKFEIPFKMQTIRPCMTILRTLACACVRFSRGFSSLSEKQLHVAEFPACVRNTAD